VAITKPSAPVAAGPGAVATDAHKAGQRGGGGVATAPAATVVEKGLPWWLWVLLGLEGYAIGWRLARGKWH
jgi:hypothetical protein